MWEISENLHRADLTAVERAEHVAEWTRLSEKPAQLAQVSGGRGKTGGVSAAARALGLDRDEVRRSIKIAGLSDETKQAARDTGQDNNQTALLAAAREPSHLYPWSIQSANRASISPKRRRAMANLSRKYVFHAAMLPPYFGFSRSRSGR